jgi:hypothetical protein
MREGDVPQCKVHTRPDYREVGLYIRLGPCNRACHIVRELENVRQFPLDAFNAQLGKYSDDNLMNADPGKAAAHYGINPDHAAGYILMERERRGLRSDRGKVHNHGDGQAA